MFRSVFRPSSGVRFFALRNYYVSASMLCLVPFCGGMLSVCVYMHCTCRCGVWMCLDGRKTDRNMLGFFVKLKIKTNNVEITPQTTISVLLYR